MDRIQEMTIFVAVAEHASFAAVARHFVVSTATVTRAVAQLERRLGTLLVVRTTRQLRLTESGVRFAADCRRLLADLSEAESSAAGIHASPSGLLTVTAPQVFGDLHVTPVLAQYLALNPQVEIRGLLMDRVAPMLDEGIDVAVRIGHLPDSSLTAVAVGSVRRMVCASPAYLAVHGSPHHPHELIDRATVSAVMAERSPAWTFTIDGQRQTLNVHSRLSLTSFNAAIHVALDGWGLTQVPSYQVRAHLESGRLCTVLEGFEVPGLPVHVVYAEGRKGSSKVRSFVDFCVTRLREDLDYSVAKPAMLS
ncbi:LysR family transcriptional regulator [Pseudomonas huanghezhanensis]|uniref:LysR family transcriptional regulator n=1 Tax=Pseudomonas huanghezhanensis TaxID=3002903 RepID=UPI002285761B|nr:LysR family transcriptional regulator [Pseudomonas sp. BSw22131]